MRVDKLLDKLNIPYAEDEFKAYKDQKVPSPPYIVYKEDNEYLNGGDFVNTKAVRSYSIELYTFKRDREIEQRIMSLLNGMEVSIYRENLSDKRLHLTLFEFEVTEKIKEEF